MVHTRVLTGTLTSSVYDIQLFAIVLNVILTRYLHHHVYQQNIVYYIVIFVIVVTHLQVLMVNAFSLYTIDKTSTEYLKFKN